MKFFQTTLCAMIAATTLVAIAAQENPTMHVSGTFDVTLAGQPADNPQARAAQIERMSIEKKYHGAIVGTSSGEMLSVKDERDTGAYVALEKVTGSLQGRSGTFLLAHSGFMSGGAIGHWSLEIVPDSGTGALAGLRGTMKFAVVEGARHSYELEYSLSGAR